MSLERVVQPSILSDVRIVDLYGKGEIIIDPYTGENVKTSSVDVTLGESYFRPNPNHGLKIFNPWSEDHVRRIWGEPVKARTAKEELAELGIGLDEVDGVLPDDKIIIAQPGEILLCHTEEFIGGVSETTTMMKARSSIGRCDIVVCNCAGWGDVGYYNRWTMEVKARGFNQGLPEILFVGRRLAQITFFETGPTLGSSYSVDGKYQGQSNIEDLKRNWDPRMMLPRLWKDREAQRNR